MIKITNYLSNCIYNLDESSPTVVRSKLLHLIDDKGKRQIGLLMSAERGSFVTIVDCINAPGHLSPFMSFLRNI